MGCERPCRSVEVERCWKRKGREKREMKNTDIENLVAKIRQIAYDLHVYLGNGFLEKVYANGLIHRLRKAGFLVEVQKTLRVFDSDGFCLGEYFADLVVEGVVVVELKTVQCIANEHYAQILNYLKITGAPAGLLINFGSYKFEVRTVIPRSAPSTPLSNTPTPTTTSAPLHFYMAETMSAPTTPTSTTPSTHLHFYTAKTIPNPTPTATTAPLHG